MGINGWHYAKSNKPDIERQIQHALICEISKRRNSLKQRRTVVIRGRVWGDVGQKVQTLSYKINKFWRPSGQHGDYN